MTFVDSESVLHHVSLASYSHLWLFRDEPSPLPYGTTEGGHF